MRFFRKIILVIITLGCSNGNHLEDFYKLLENDSVLKLKINLTQSQFEKNYNSFGDFFVLGPRKYFYDSLDLKISVNNDVAITKNYKNKQIVYNDLTEGELNLFDILSGNRNYIKFLDDKVDINRYDFQIPTMGFKGHFLFEPISGNLKLIFFKNDFNHSASINIYEIEILDDYNPKIEKEDFEVIDLRG